jgi:hypothetical protein
MTPAPLSLSMRIKVDKLLLTFHIAVSIDFVAFLHALRRLSRSYAIRIYVLPGEKGINLDDR